MRASIGIQLAVSHLPDKVDIVRRILTVGVVLLVILADCPAVAHPSRIVYRSDQMFLSQFPGPLFHLMHQCCHFIKILGKLSKTEHARIVVQFVVDDQVTGGTSILKKFLVICKLQDRQFLVHDNPPSHSFC